jgi:hypothetical protein
MSNFSQERVNSSPQLVSACQEVSYLISMAPGSQEATFLSEDEHEEGESSMARVADKVPKCSQIIRHRLLK